MLEVAGVRLKLNDLSPELREKLAARFAKLGRFAKYKFHISHKNPDPEKHGGERLLPATYMLDPVSFYINDKGRKKIGLPDERYTDQHGDIVGFKNVSLQRQHKAILTLDLEKLADQDVWAYIELHPKNPFGLYYDKTMEKVIEPIDEVRDARRKTESRKLRQVAMDVANGFSVQQDKDFASAMGWDEDMDHFLLKDKIESLAETDPAFFAEFMEQKSVPYRAMITRAESANIIMWVSDEYKYIWGSTRETIVAFGRQENLDRLERFTEWLLSDKTGTAIYEKIKKMLAAQTRAVTS